MNINNIVEKVIIGVIVITLAGVSNVILKLSERVTTLEINVLKASLANPNDARAALDLSAGTAITPASDIPTIKPERLLEIITSAQLYYIPASIGEEDFESFTDDEFVEFIDSGAPKNIANRIARQKVFVAIAFNLKRLDPIERDDLLIEAEGLHRPTFAQLGRIPRDGSGQTDAGSRAELAVARAIVSEVKQFLKLSEQELHQTYFS